MFVSPRDLSLVARRVQALDASLLAAVTDDHPILLRLHQPLHRAHRRALLPVPEPVLDDVPGYT